MSSFGRRFGQTVGWCCVALTLATPRLAGAQNQSLNQSFGATTAGSTAQSVNASEVSSTVTLIVLGAGLLAGAGGGITTTMYKKDERARLRAQPTPVVAPPPAPEPLPLPYPTPAPLPPVTPGAPSAPPLPEPSPPPPPPQSRWAPDGGPSLDAMVLARAWLVANEVQLKQDLALGAGPALDDLAGLAGIAPARRASFGKLLQRHRARLLTPHAVTPRQAAEVMSRVGELVLADPLLRLDGQAALAAR